MDNISTPEELLHFMSNNINYGYLTKDNKVVMGNSSNDWYNSYKLQSYEEVLNNLVGNCFDQVEFERNWFLEHNYEIKTIFMMLKLNYENNYPTHSFLVYKENDKWCLFENADFNNRGIYKFDSFSELIRYKYNHQYKLLKSLNASDEELDNLIMREYNKPESGISAEEYLDFVINSKRI